MIIKKNKNQPQKENQYHTEEVDTEQEAVSSEDISDDELFDISDIDFNSRIERRQGDRRRGYRRIDDRSLVSRAQQEAISIKENAKADGYKEGLQKAEQDISKLASAMEKFLTAKDEIYKEISPKILEISMEVAKKIIKQEVETNKDLLFAIIVDALEKLTKNEKQITLKVSPEDKEYVKTHIDEIMQRSQLEAKVTVQQDMKLLKGSVIVETTNGLIDSSIATGLQIIEEMFKTIQGE